MVGSVKLLYFSKSDVSAVQGYPRSWFWPHRKRLCDFLLVRQSNLGPILHRFGYIAAIMCSWPHPYSTIILGCSRCTRSAMLGSMWGDALSYSAVKLFSKYSNLYEKHTSTSQTDRLTNDILWHNHALCVASRGKKPRPRCFKSDRDEIWQEGLFFKYLRTDW